MKKNIFLYLLYGLYAVLAVILVRNIILFPNPLILLKTIALFSAPIVVALIVSIVLKKSFLRGMVKDMSGRKSLALATKASFASLGLILMYGLFLGLVSSMLRLVAPETEPLMVLGIVQTMPVVLVELLALLTLSAWFSRTIEYHVIWTSLQDVDKKIARRALLYANVVTYLMVTIIFVIWVAMMFYQWPEWFWSLI